MPVVVYKSCHSPNLKHLITEVCENDQMKKLISTGVS